MHFCEKSINITFKVIILMTKININNTDVEVAVKDIIDSDFDAIVVPSNSRLLPSGTLRCKVLREAGAKVQLECNKIINKIGVISCGVAVMTSGGNLKAKYIIHVVGPRLGQGKEGKKLALCTLNSLKLADDKGLSSIALNPISIENLGFNAKICAEIMLPTIKKYITEKNKNLKKIGIYLSEKPEFQEFEKVLKNMN